METARQCLKAAAGRFRAAGIDTAALDAEVLLADVIGVRREELFLDPERRLRPDEAAAFQDRVSRREGREPTARILGIREFWSLDFGLNEDTLIPRPDSETLVEAALAELRADDESTTGGGLRIMDLGTGSGCLLVALLHELPEAAGTGIDVSAPALEAARANARANRVERRSEFIEANWLADLDPGDLGGPFDLIVSNPPYIDTAALDGLEPEVARFEPRRALNGGADGLDAYRTIAAQVRPFLKEHAPLVLEVGDGIAGMVSDILVAGGFHVRSQREDLGGRVRAVVAGA